MKVVEYWHGPIKNYRYDGDISGTIKNYRYVGDVSASPSLTPTCP